MCQLLDSYYYPVKFQKMAHPSTYESALKALREIFSHLLKEIDYFRSVFIINGSRDGVLSMWLKSKGIAQLLQAITMGTVFETQKSEAKVEESGKHESLIFARLGIEASSEIELNKEIKLEHERLDKVSIDESQNQMAELNSPLYEQPQRYLEEIYDMKPLSSISYPKENYTRGPYKSYTIEEKELAVSMILDRKLSITETSKRLNIPCKNIKRWSVQGTLRKKGGGRRRYSPQMEAETFEWIKSSFRSGERVCIEQIQAYARSRSDDQNFKASRGWAIKFINRFNLRNKYEIF